MSTPSEPPPEALIKEGSSWVAPHGWQVFKRWRKAAAPSGPHPLKHSMKRRKETRDLPPGLKISSAQRAQRSKKFNLARNFQSRSKFSILLDNFNLDILNSRQYPVLPFLVFLEKGKENHPKNKDFYSHRTPKIPGKGEKNAQKKQGIHRRGKKQGIPKKQGKEGQGKIGPRWVARSKISFSLEPLASCKAIFRT